MLSLLNDIECYCPEYIGRCDILLAADKIYKIAPAGQIEKSQIIQSIIQCEGLLAFPGIIDQHVHILGAGGEQGYLSRIAELDSGAILNAGVTTAVGLLGADGFARSMENLYAHSEKLEKSGLTVFLYCGSYSAPPVTLTGSLINDILFIDKIIGLKTAISDHRSSQPSLGDLTSLAAQAHLGGLLSGKAGIVHIHVGDGKDGIRMLRELLEHSDLPKELFVPTHLNRNSELFLDAMNYCKSGGNIDLTSGELAGISVPEAIGLLCRRGIDLSRVTVSSDANGSIPGGGIAGIETLFRDIIDCIRMNILNPGDAFKLVTENVARNLKLYPRKGTLKEGSDADILITDRNYHMRMLFCRGKLLVNNEP